MIRHTVLLRWTEQATAEQKQRVADELAKLPPIVGSLRSFVLGHDAGFAEGNFDFAITADFDDEAGFVAYRDAPAHVEIITHHIRPILAQRVAVQFEY